MTCKVYIPQVQIISGDWIEVGIPSASFEDADNQKDQYPLTSKIIGFRVLQNSCLERKIQRVCCGG